MNPIYIHFLGLAAPSTMMTDYIDARMLLRVMKCWDRHRRCTKSWPTERATRKFCTMWGPRSIAKLVHNFSNYGLWYANNYSYWGESKATNITGGPHIVGFVGRLQYSCWIFLEIHQTWWFHDAFMGIFDGISWWFHGIEPTWWLQWKGYF